MSAFSDEPSRSSVVLDREADQEKSREPVRPADQMSYVWLVAREERSLGV